MPADDSPYTRLHITPLDESLLSVVIPSSVLPSARNISYHTLETFPEKRYGFVDLPVADADKLKKKLNGAVLRGAKMRVEKARSGSIPEPTAEGGSSRSQKGKEKENERDKDKKSKDKSKKRKREIDVIPGVELDDRKIKRGWTTTEQDMIKEKRARREKKDKKSKEDKKDRKQEKKKTKSKYTDGPECLFKTKLPGTAPPPQKDGEDSTGHKKKKRKGDREIVVHEFEKTVKYPSFLKSSTAASSAEAATFQEGVGWLDSKGNVVEAVSIKKPPPVVQTKPRKPKAAAPPVLVEDEDDTTSSSGTSSSDEESELSDAESSDSAEALEKAEVKVVKEEATRNKSETGAPSLSSPSAPSKPEGGRKRSSGSISSLTIKIPPSTPSKVHPLEALYKRPKDEAGAAAGAPKEPEPFSFFDNEDVEAEGDDAAAPRLSQPPMTPFTKQDFEFRNVRSAAPTPDTAHPTRSFNIWPRADTLDETLEEEDEGGDEEGGKRPNDTGDREDTSMADASPSGRGGSSAAPANNADDDVDDADEDGAPPVSEFEKQFWESRGDLNRKWRRRRKMAAKEKRYRENKARAQRAI